MDGNIRREKLDTDMTDEKAWKMRPELAARSKARKAKEASAMAKKVKADKKGVKTASHTVLDTDHRDEAAWQQRAKLRSASKARKAKEARELAEANKRIFSAIKRTTRSDEIDDNLMDEHEWNVRPDLAAESAEFRKREALDLKMRNAEIKDRLQKIKPQVIITSREGKEIYNDPSEWVDPLNMSPYRTRDKYPIDPEDMIRQIGDPRSPSWLPRWEKYQWAA